MKKYVLILVTSLVTTLAFAQSYTEEVDLMQAAFGMAKKEIVSAFVTPSTSQSEAFWTLYDEYET